MPITPISPCSASPKCKNIDFDPVEFSVAEIFIAIIALLPIPVRTILPLQTFNLFIISQKFASITLERFEIDFDSRLSVSRAIFFIIC